MVLRQTSKNLREAKECEQRAVRTAFAKVVTLHHAEDDPISTAILKLAKKGEGKEVGKVVRAVRLEAAKRPSAFLYDLALAIFVGAPLFPSLQKAVDWLPPPLSTLDLFTIARKKAEEMVSRSGHTFGYYLHHPRIVWSAFVSTYLGSRLVGWLSPFDPKAFARNTSGRIFEEMFTDHLEKTLKIDWTVGPTPTVGDHLAEEAALAIEALGKKKSTCFQHGMWVYVNLQNRRGMSERRRSHALFEASRKNPATFRLASLSVDAPFYRGFDRKLFTLQDHKRHILKELRKGLSPSPSSWYAFSVLEGEEHEWWDNVQMVVEKAFALAQLTDYRCPVFHELVVLGLIRAWQGFCCRKSTGEVISTVACKECADRGGSVNAAFVWAFSDKEEEQRAKTVEAVLWGRPLLVRQRLIEKRRTCGLEALVRAFHPSTVKTFLDEIWHESCKGRWKRSDPPLYSIEYY